MYSARKIHSILGNKCTFSNWVCSTFALYPTQMCKVRNGKTIDYNVTEVVALHLITKDWKSIFREYHTLTNNGLSALKKAILKGRILNILNMAKVNKENGIVANNSSNVPQIFNNEQFGSIRIIMQDNGEPLFCLNDVCQVLGISNSRQVVSKNLNGKGVYKIYILSDGGEQETNFVNEPSFYKVVLRSNSKLAEQFQDWVTEEVLPSIRKNGSYSVQPQQTFPMPKTMQEALRLYADSLDREQKLESKNTMLENKVQQDKPSVEYANAVGTTENTKNLQEGIKELFPYLIHPNNAIGILVAKKVLFRADKNNGSSDIVKHSSEYNDVFKVTEIKTKRGTKTQVLIRLTPTAKRKLEKLIGIDVAPQLYSANMKKIFEIKAKIKNEIYFPQN